MHKYCGSEPFSKDYHKCPLYQEKTGTRSILFDQWLLVCANCELDDNCYELTLLLFRDIVIVKVRRKHLLALSNNSRVAMRATRLKCSRSSCKP